MECCLLLGVTTEVGTGSLTDICTPRPASSAASCGLSLSLVFLLFLPLPFPLSFLPEAVSGVSSSEPYHGGNPMDVSVSVGCDDVVGSAIVGSAVVGSAVVGSAVLVPAVLVPGPIYLVVRTSGAMNSGL